MVNETSEVEVKQFHSETKARPSTRNAMKSHILKLQKRVLNNSKGEVDNKENAQGNESGRQGSER